MATVAPYPATLDDLAKVQGKAELIGGRIVTFMASGDQPATVAFEIAVSLREHAKASGVGKAYSDGVGYALASPLSSGRQSFEPDASFWAGPPAPNRMRFLRGVPVFAVEVRSEHDYGPTPDREYADKRADYFEAGTLVVWDVDPVAETVTCYRAADPDVATVFRRGETADAEPAVPGWRLSVDAIFG